MIFDVDNKIKNAIDKNDPQLFCELFYALTSRRDKEMWMTFVAGKCKKDFVEGVLGDERSAFYLSFFCTRIDEIKNAIKDQPWKAKPDLFFSILGAGALKKRADAGEVLAIFWGACQESGKEAFFDKLILNGYVDEFCQILTNDQSAKHHFRSYMKNFPDTLSHAIFKNSSIIKVLVSVGFYSKQLDSDLFETALMYYGDRTEFFLESFKTYPHTLKIARLIDEKKHVLDKLLPLCDINEQRMILESGVVNGMPNFLLFEKSLASKDQIMSVLDKRAEPKVKKSKRAL